VIVSRVTDKTAINRKWGDSREKLMGRLLACPGSDRETANNSWVIAG
jgi:hypothetical protein